MHVQSAVCGIVRDRGINLAGKFSSVPVPWHNAPVLEGWVRVHYKYLTEAWSPDTFMVLPREGLRSLAEQGGATIVGCSPSRVVDHFPVSQQLPFRWWYEWIDDEESLESVAMWHKVDNMKPEVVPHVFSTRHAEIVWASGRLQILRCASGRPSFEMSRSFTDQMLRHFMIRPSGLDRAQPQANSVEKYVLWCWCPGEHRRGICTSSSVWRGLGIRSCLPDG